MALIWNNSKKQHYHKIIRVLKFNLVSSVLFKNHDTCVRVGEKGTMLNSTILPDKELKFYGDMCRITVARVCKTDKKLNLQN
jgi:hypothetical protein